MDFFIYFLIFLLVFNSVWFVGLVVYVMKLFYEVQNLRRNHDYYSNEIVRQNENDLSDFFRRFRDENGNDDL